VGWEVDGDGGERIPGAGAGSSVVPRWGGQAGLVGGAGGA